MQINEKEYEDGNKGLDCDLAKTKESGENGGRNVRFNTDNQDYIFDMLIHCHKC